MSYSAERWCVQYIQPTTYLNGKKCMQNMARCWLVGEKKCDQCSAGTQHWVFLRSSDSVFTNLWVPDVREPSSRKE